MIKTATFAVMHFSIAFGVAWALTGSPIVGGLVALVEPAVNTVAFYFHDKIWKRIEQVRSNSESNGGSQFSSALRCNRVA